MALPDRSVQEKQLQTKGAKASQSGLDAMMDTLEAPFSREVTVRTDADATAGRGGTSESERFDIGQELDYVARQAMGAMYGDTFPLLKNDPDDQDWVKWGEALWDRHASAVTHRLHIIERNRLFRMGVQWISSLGVRNVREERSN